MKNTLNLKTVVFALLSITLSWTAQAAPKCTYELAKDSLAIEWTAFKTTQKVAVHGAFKKFDITGKTKAKSLSQLFTGITVTVDPTSVDSGNPGRDKTLTESFFSPFTKSISGKIKSVSEADKALVLSLTLNGETKDITMHYESAAQAYKATGSLDILDFHGKTALDSLNAKCLDLHKGADGVSRTWSDVELTLKANVSSTCK